MTTADFLILYTFAESDLLHVLGPTVIGDNLGFTRQHVSNRISELVDHDLLHQVDDGKYEITERGSEFVAGNLDANDLEANDR